MGRKSCCRMRRNSEESLTADTEEDPSLQETKKKWPIWKKIVVWSFVTLLILIIVVFLLVWVVVPIVFQFSIAFQRLMIFMPFNSPRNPDFNNPEAHGISGVQNFYISVTDVHDRTVVTSIGTWLILPERDKHSVTSNISKIIAETEFDILIYLHGVLENRAKAIAKYEVLRKMFLIISIDHRGYGDSGKEVEMTELGMINDHLQIYDWIMNHNFTNNIYYWGHSLGAALSCHILKALTEEKDVVPKGLILESAFTTLAEVVENNVIGKIFRWLPYFDSAILDPLDANGFHFYSTSNILDVNCPIMMLHAEDDRIVPSFLGSKLADVAKTKRNQIKQGNVTFYLFPSELAYGHNDIIQDPRLPEYVVNFKNICESFEGAP